jgi:hypothetical protein
MPYKANKIKVVMVCAYNTIKVEEIKVYTNKVIIRVCSSIGERVTTRAF